ncbi:hypothetical protein EGW08_004900 [Elysia chlorotica]|uniref:Lipocalin/cytosolic fatty-acid binding domain-containing protein n=1 Tax=Elysia chlorotica TaxID=188477 RepID=A0A433U0T3_ELYCH|nr:hypothetical protein EGW08_004900 [Elysia chlorotica]
MTTGVETFKFDMDKSPEVTDFAFATGTPKEFCTKDVMSKVRFHHSVDGEQFTSKVDIPGMAPRVFHYKLGVPYDFTAQDGRKFKITTTCEAEKFIEKMVADNGDEIITVREDTGNGFKSTTTTKGKTITHYMVRV